MAKAKAPQEGAVAVAPAPEESGSIFSRLYHGNTHFQFVGHRRRWYTISSVVILIGLAALGIRGLNFGIEFKGGTSWEVTNTQLSVSQARNAVASTGVKEATVVSLGSGSSTTIEVQADLSIYPADQKSTLETKVTDALAAAAHVPANRVSLNDVGPTWGGEITTKAIQALIGFFVAILLYITLRFELKMAAAALIAVIHDILVTVGVYAIVGFEVTPATVIAILTILGYSLYDTIVVFDRVQENVKGMVNSGRMTYSDAVDASMNQVLMRSLNTSIVAIIPILSVLLIGAELLGATTLQQFGLALFIGLTTGAYSSIYIASPILAQLKEREPRYKALAERLAKSQAAEEAKAARRGAKQAPQAAAEDAGTVSEPVPASDGAQAGDGAGGVPEGERKRPKLVEPGQRSGSGSRRRQGPKRR
ncbi:MAG: protein translocase subunit SecF [Actinomycetota bacterium]|nr:protein translocase subunit SecF [Actinomycetota bacterium]MDA8209135.1 protein translocase subunit SecF [Actinomycetota bacterium]